MSASHLRDEVKSRGRLCDSLLARIPRRPGSINACGPCAANGVRANQRTRNQSTRNPEPRTRNLEPGPHEPRHLKIHRHQSVVVAHVPKAFHWQAPGRPGASAAAAVPRAICGTDFGDAAASTSSPVSRMITRRFPASVTLPAPKRFGSSIAPFRLQIRGAKYRAKFLAAMEAVQHSIVVDARRVMIRQHVIRQPWYTS